MSAYAYRTGVALVLAVSSGPAAPASSGYGDNACTGVGVARNDLFSIRRYLAPAVQGCPAMSDSPLPRLKAYLPASFAERGVLVPFTTPLLAGARARSYGRAGTELLLPKPSGGSGLYVFPWSSVTQLCRTTVHDRQLNKRLGALTDITPATVRRAARDIAIEGLAGREAKTAGLTAAQLDQQAQALASFLLLLAVRERVQPQGLDLARFAAPVADLQDAAQRTVIAHAAQLGLSPDALLLHLKQAGDAFSNVGVHGSSRRPRVLILLDMLARLHEEIVAWIRERPYGSGELGGMIAEVASATLTCAAITLRDARAATQDAVALLQQWPANRTQIRRNAERPEWLLDGWEQICQLWHAAENDAARAAALEEIAMLVPVLPKETSEWVHLSIQANSLFTYRNTILVREDWRTGGNNPAGPQGRRTVQRNEDWRTASMIDFVARNERLRALSI